MDTKEVVDQMIDDILAGNNLNAREKFDAAIADKLNDAIAAKKIEVAQSIYGSVDQQDAAQDTEIEAEIETETEEETDENTETSEE